MNTNREHRAPVLQFKHFATFIKKTNFLVKKVFLPKIKLLKKKKITGNADVHTHTIHTNYLLSLIFYTYYSVRN